VKLENTADLKSVDRKVLTVQVRPWVPLKKRYIIMSMNLAFLTNNKNHIEFPFQTPTSLSYAVMKEKTRENRLKLILEYIDNTYDKTYTQNIKEECTKMLLDQSLTLIII